MDKSMIKSILRSFWILPFFFLTSCMVQFSSVPKLKNTRISDNNTALLAISAQYKMNMSSSKDIKFYFKETTTGKIIAPDYRDKTNNNLYFNVPPGIYKVSLIAIKETSIARSIIFDDLTKTITKSIGLANSNISGNIGPGLSFSGAILIGEKKLVYKDTFSDLIKIEPNTAYYLGDYKFEGYIESIFNDMTNIRILKTESVPQEKLESFKKVYYKSYPNSTQLIITNESLFTTDSIDLSKANALKK